MQIEAELDIFNDDSLFDYIRTCALKTNGQTVTWQDGSALYQEIERKILSFLLSQDIFHFQKTAANLALVGTLSRDRAHAFKNFEEFFADKQIVQVGLGKFFKKKWKKHKKAILVGIGVTAIVTTVVIVSVCSGGTAASAAAAGGSAIKALAKKKKSKSTQTSSPPNPPPIKKDSPNASSFASVDFHEKGVVVNKQYHSYDEILQPTNREALLESFHSQASSYSKETLAQTPPQLSIKPKPYQAKEFPEKLDKSPNSFCTQGHSQNQTLDQAARDQALGHLYPDICKPPKASSIPEIPQSSIKKTKPSATEKLESKPTSCQIGLINGINTSLEEAQEHVKYLKGFVPDQEVNLIYNKTHGLAADLGEAFALNYKGISLGVSKKLREEWEAFHKQNKENSQTKYLQICHSGGAIHVKNTLKKAPQEIRDRIIVVAIGPAAIIPKKLCYNAFNYVSRKDIVHLGEIVSCSPDNPTQILNALKDRKEVIFLEPNPEAEGLDHYLQSPTYKNKIMQHIRDHFRKKGIYP